MAALGIDWMRLIWQGINFVILLFLLQRLLFKPVLRLMDARAQKIRDSVEEAERARAEAHETMQANQALLDEARKQAAELIESATRTADQIREQAAANARGEAEQLLERARSEIALEREQAIAQVRKHAVDLALLAAGNVIEQTLTGPEHYRLVTQFLEKAEVDGH
ncbi:MAG: F0F1 ATP synthase subunit B [Chloroflexota bacterium]|nr:F0F1 ATP synthase subunit B [Chloroflexota bacterium]